MKKSKPERLCEACGRAVWEKDALSRARHFFESVVEMFDNGQIKAFTLTASDAEKLKLILNTDGHGPTRTGTDK